ncbi:MAG: PqiC family protein [Steroidobacteraceae bacterium]
MRQSFPARWALILLTCCSGCGSVPIRYYTLTPPAVPGTIVASTPALPAGAVAVHLPAQDNRLEMIVRDGTDELVPLDNEHWASPLADQIRDAVRMELRRALSESPAPASGQGAGAIRVRIDVQRMDAELERYTVLEATWTVAFTGSTVSGRTGPCFFRAYDPIGAGYGGVVQGYQQEVKELTDDIGADVIALRATGHGQCGDRTIS